MQSCMLKDAFCTCSVAGSRPCDFRLFSDKCLWRRNRAMAHQTDEGVWHNGALVYGARPVAPAIRWPSTARTHRPLVVRAQRDAADTLPSSPAEAASELAASSILEPPWACTCWSGSCRRPRRCQYSDRPRHRCGVRHRPQRDGAPHFFQMMASTPSATAHFFQPWRRPGGSPDVGRCL